MEQFDSYNPVSSQHLIQKIIAQGFISAKKQFVLIDDVIKKAYAIILSYSKHDQSSLIQYMLQSTFAKTQSKSQTYDQCNSLFNSLELFNNKESATILYLFAVDNALQLCLFYINCKQTIYIYTKSQLPLDDIILKFNDIIEISKRIFEQFTISELLALLQSQMNYNSVPIDPLISLDAGELQQILIKLYIMKQTHETYDSPIKKSPKKERTYPEFQGFYKWGNPLFGKDEFLKNPANQRMLKELSAHAKRFPQMKNSIINTNEYLSPLKHKKETDVSKDNMTVLDMLRTQSRRMNQDKQSPNTWTLTPKKQNNQDSLSSFQVTSSFKKEDLIQQKGCLFTYQIPKTQTQLIDFIALYNLEYFDPILSLPKPLNEQVTYENIIDLYEELKEQSDFQPQIFQGASYLSSYDPRYLRINQYGRIEAISQFEGWILAKNEFGHIGCCASTYIQKI